MVDIGYSRSISTPPGGTLRRGIPGFTGFVPARKSEDVFGVTIAEANARARQHRAAGGASSPQTGDSARRRFYSSAAERGFDGTADGGSINSVGGMMGGDMVAGPRATCSSTFSNPFGTTKRRAGGSIPGYGGHIPGKSNGSVIGTSFARASVAAAEASRLRDPPHWPPVQMSTMKHPPWQEGAERDARQHGAKPAAFTPGPQGTFVKRGHATTDHSTWRLWEPKDAMDKVSY
mmetsp:Transcript_17692/g.41099  ORF Transcript_17692/g.41099 Transcript_17692/m.41099 type:complete len:233 (+) Transcript_17692:80-778(+)